VSARAGAAPAARPRPRQGAPAPGAPARPRVLPAPERRRAGRKLLAGGALWVALLAAMLGGIVALNVAALRTSLALNQVTAQAQDLRTRNDVLAARTAALSRPARVNAFARRAGMVPAAPAPSDYLQLAPATARPPAAQPARRRAAHDRHGPRRPGRRGAPPRAR
jgi:hypothetical protein